MSHVCGAMSESQKQSNWLGNVPWSLVQNLCWHDPKCAFAITGTVHDPNHPKSAKYLNSVCLERSKNFNSSSSEFHSSLLSSVCLSCLMEQHFNHSRAETIWNVLVASCLKTFVLRCPFKIRFCRKDYPSLLLPPLQTSTPKEEFNQCYPVRKTTDWLCSQSALRRQQSFCGPPQFRPQGWAIYFPPWDIENHWNERFPQVSVSKTNQNSASTQRRR